MLSVSTVYWGRDAMVKDRVCVRRGRHRSLGYLNTHVSYVVGLSMRNVRGEVNEWSLPLVNSWAPRRSTRSFSALKRYSEVI